MPPFPVAFFIPRELEPGGSLRSPKPEPELKLELEPELKPELKLGLEPELK
jgi:hypothetical protein